MAGASSALQTKRELGKATRDAFGRALEALGADHPERRRGRRRRGQLDPDRVVRQEVPRPVLQHRHRREQPGRASPAGLAASGKTSVIASFAAFITCNAYDQLRMSVAYPELNVKVVGSHAGISIGEDGASQMGIEDVALACALPGFVVIVPADEESAKAATRGDARAQGAGLSSRRASRRAQDLHRRPAPFTIGKANRLRDGHGPDDRRQRPDGRPRPRRRRDARRRGDPGPRPRHAHRQADRSRRARGRRARRPVRWSSPRSTWRTAAWAASWP